MAVFFTSDTHFGSERARTLSMRPFSSVEEMDMTMIKNWNDKIKKDDIVYHLGDFGDYSVKEKLNGNIHLILGNYEEDDIKEGKTSSDELLKIGFCSICKNALVTINDKKVYLVHKPLECDKRFMNLFGHIHGRQKVKRFGIDVGVDAHYFYPLSENDIYFYLNAIENHYDENVFCS